jgi:hypothetical protein
VRASQNAYRVRAGFDGLQQIPRVDAAAAGYRLQRDVLPNFELRKRHRYLAALGSVSAEIHPYLGLIIMAAHYVASPG